MTGVLNLYLAKNGLESHNKPSHVSRYVNVISSVRVRDLRAICENLRNNCACKLQFTTCKYHINRLKHNVKQKFAIEFSFDGLFF